MGTVASPVDVVDAAAVALAATQERIAVLHMIEINNVLARPAQPVRLQC